MPRLLRLLYQGKGDEGPHDLRLLCVALAAVPFVSSLLLLRLLLPLLPHPTTSVLLYHSQRVD